MLESSSVFLEGAVKVPSITTIATEAEWGDEDADSSLAVSLWRKKITPGLVAVVSKA